MPASHAPVFRLPVRVYYEDTDAGGIVYYANYLRYLERARTEWLRQLGTPRERLRADCGWVFVVTDVNVRYAKPAVLDDLLEVRTQVAALQRASLRFAQAVWRGDTLLLEAQVGLACIDQHSHRPVRLPPDLHGQFQACLS